MEASSESAQVLATAEVSKEEGSLTTNNPSADSVEARCHCGRVTLVAKSRPTRLTSCNCTICHCYGTVYAYYSELDVSIKGETHIYEHGDKMISFHRCAHCGCVTHWAAGTNSDRTLDRMAINARLFPREVLAATRVRHFDGFDTWTYRDDGSGASSEGEQKPFPRPDIGCNL